MCQNLQRLQSSEENLVHICISKKLLLWLLNTLHRNRSTYLCYSCGFDCHTCHTLRPSHCYGESQEWLTSWLGRNYGEILEVSPALSSRPRVSLASPCLLRCYAARKVPNCFCFTKQNCFVCIISLLVLEVRMLLTYGGGWERVANRTFRRMALSCSSCPPSSLGETGGSG